MAKNNKATVKNLAKPDERRDFEGHGHLDVVGLSDEITFGRGEFEPGWRWSVDVKPIAGTESCDAEHFGYCVSGGMTIRMDDGKELQIKAGEAFHIPPGHDAWVKGERCVMLDFVGFKDYAKRRQKSQAA